jgi:Bromodomain
MMSTPSFPAEAASMASTVAVSTASSSSPNEEDLRKQLREAMQNLKKREPLDPTYKRLLLNGVVTPRRPVLPKTKFYKRVGSKLRERVEKFLEQNQGKDPFDRISQRQPMEDEKMRAALTLREAKEHEQQALLDATLAALPRRNGMDELTWRRHLEGIALGLQSREKVSSRTKTPPPLASTAEQSDRARQQAELDRQRTQARAREDSRRQREEEERQRREDDIERRKKSVETPRQALHQLYEPIFRKLWQMEFQHLGGTNPFRIVIDRENCASVGAPDYFDVIDKPMNLTYIQRKVDAMEYDNLSAFFSDVDLMIQNALAYNSDPSNPYRAAADEMKKRYNKIVGRVLKAIQQKQQGHRR